jgi:protein O-mannosyl-transferase
MGTIRSNNKIKLEPASKEKPQAGVAPYGDWAHHLLRLTALWAAAFAVYSNSFQADLVFDSQRAILGDSRIQAVTSENTRRIWNEDYWSRTGSSALYRPFSTFSYLFNYSILGNGSRAAGYHWVNFVLHAANVGLVYLLGLLIFEAAGPAFALAALWGLHPVLTESVTNVAGRPDLLGAFGVLAGFLCYVRSAGAAGPRRAAWLAALAAAAAIGVFSKESGIVLVAVMVVYGITFPHRLSWRARAGGYLAMSLPVLVFMVTRSRVLAQVSSMVISFCDNPLLGSGFWTARITAVKVLGKYLWLLLWPAQLSSDYSYNQVPVFGWGAGGWEDAKTVLAVLVWIAIGIAALAGLRRAKPIFFFAAFFLATLAPVSNLVILIGSIMAERFLYLPSVGFAGCLVWAARAGCRYIPVQWKPATTVLPVLLVLICAVLGARSYARNFDWHDERSLWISAVRACPRSEKTHTNLASVLVSQAPPDYASATRELEETLAILDPLPDTRSLSSVYANAGLCYRIQGDPAKALAVLLRGRKIDQAWNEAVSRRNQLDGKTISAVGTPALYLDLARVYLSLGHPDQAIEALRYGRSIDPQPAFFEELSQAYGAMGQSEQSVISLFEGLAVDSTQTNLASLVVEFYREQAPQSCALANTPAGLSLNLNCPQVHTRICAASRNVVQMYTQMRDPGAAAAIYQSAVRGLGCPPDMFR